MRVPPARDVAGGPGDRLVFRVCATFYAATLDVDACGRLVAGLRSRGLLAEATPRRARGIVTVTLGLGAGTAEQATRDAEQLLALAGREAGMGDVPHALAVVRIPR
jgi:hypothetical protein